MSGNRYSIRDLEMFTGIKAHTIRIWEQRYRLVEPERTDTNIRTYSEDDLKFLLNVSLLNKNGYRISTISRMAPEEVQEKVMALFDNDFTYSTQIDALTVSIMDFDENAFEKLLSTNILRIGFEETFLHIIFPFMLKVGLLWQTGVIRPAHEHFISNLIRQKMLVAIDAQVVRPSNGSRRFMLFLPDRELHELTLMFINYLLRARNHQTLYLGASVPFEDLEMAFEDYRPDCLITACISYPSEDQVQQWIDRLAYMFKRTEIYASGRQVLQNELRLPGNVKCLKSLSEALTVLDLNDNSHRNSKTLAMHH